MSQNKALPKLFIELDPAINERLHAEVKREASYKRAVVEAALDAYLALREHHAAKMPVATLAAAAEVNAKQAA